MSRNSPLPARILIPVANPLTAEELIKLGSAILDKKNGELTALGIVEVPEGMPLSEGATRARHARRLLQRVLDFAPEGTTIQPIVRIGRRAAEGIIEASGEQESDLVIFGWGGKTPNARNGHGPAVFSPTIDEVVRDSPCDIAVVKQRGATPIRRILVPVRGGPHAELAIRFADAIAQTHGATVAVLHLVPPGITATVRAQAEHALAAFMKQHLHAEGEALLREAPNLRAAILREAEKADLVVMGASAQPFGADGEPYLFGALPESIAARAKPTVIVVKTREQIASATFDQLAARAETLAAADRAAEEVRAIPARVERWFGESNFHHSEFRDLARLTALKAKQGTTVSLVLPTLNEAETIGPIVERALKEMVERFPLLDEVLVIDSDSDDRTRQIATDAGARVVSHSEVLTRYGTFRGKGEALWKSLYETTGDIVVWADTDVHNWHHRMVYGTLGPLLHEPRLQYVKGYYQRPIVEHGVLTEGGGGRVTELVARPLINLFFPELSGLIQPLAGEYAGRRSLLESIPFFTGYAVEIGHLDRCGGAGRARRARPGRPRAPGPPQPGARGPVADVVRDPPGDHEAARGAAARAVVRGARLDDEAAALGPQQAVARGHRARRPGAPADDPHPRVPRTSPGDRGGDRTGRPVTAVRPGPGRGRSWPDMHPMTERPESEPHLDRIELASSWLHSGPKAPFLARLGASRRPSSHGTTIWQHCVPMPESPALTISALDVETYRAAIPELAALIVDAVADRRRRQLPRGRHRWTKPPRGGGRAKQMWRPAGRRRSSPSRTGAWWAPRCSSARSTRTRRIAPRSARSSSSQSHRRRGLASALMRAAEDRARAEGRWLLVLDTVSGSAADAFYRSLGWQETGVVPNYALNPDGQPWAATFFWKDLR